MKRAIKRPNKFSFILLGLLFFNNRLADKEMEVEVEVEVEAEAEAEGRI
jgi:predicted nicotinamide N-methyase